MPSYLRDTPPPRGLASVRPRLAVLVALACLACGGGTGPQLPAPQSPQETLTLFLAAVKGNDLDRMGALWGDEHGPAKNSMKPAVLRQRLTVMRIYLDHIGYRIIEGPLPVPGNPHILTSRMHFRPPPPPPVPPP